MMAAPYTARVFWVSVVEPLRFEHVELAGCIRRSYELVVESLSKKAQDALEADGTEPA
jgi:predicted DNA-binding protein (MmcQ/YjbR family)